MKKFGILIALLVMTASNANAGWGTYIWKHNGNSSTLQYCSYCWNGEELFLLALLRATS